jgi:hypothetical protein
VPNYTSPQYAQNSGRAMSAWCSACHTAYSQPDSVAGQPYDYKGYESVLGADGVSIVTSVGPRERHRHLVDVPLSIGQGAGRGLTVALVDDPGLPLEMGVGLLAAGADHTSAKVWDSRGNVSCLTCHRAHGSESTMSGWAVAKLATTPVGPGPIKVTPGVTTTAATFANPLGVAPNYSQAILRYDNRGVCEKCHNK